MIYSICLPNLSRPEVCLRCLEFGCVNSCSCFSSESSSAINYESDVGTDETAGTELERDWECSALYSKAQPIGPAFLRSAERPGYPEEPGFLQVAAMQGDGIYAEALPHFYTKSKVFVEIIDLDSRKLHDYLEFLSNKHDRSQMIRHLTMIFTALDGRYATSTISSWLIAKELWLSESCTISLECHPTYRAIFISLCCIGERLRKQGNSWKAIQSSIEAVASNFCDYHDQAFFENEEEYVAYDYNEMITEESVQDRTLQLSPLTKGTFSG